MFLSIPLKLILSLCIGAAIGLEREWHKLSENKSDPKPVDASVGVRSFSLITLLGAVLGFLGQSQPGIFLIISSAIMLLILFYYGFTSFVKKDMGITTEIALIFSFVIGILITTEVIPVQSTLSLAIVLMLILSRKEKIKSIVAGIKRYEFDAFLSFAIIALVILPFLPNQGYTISSIPNIQQITSSIGINLNKFSSIEIINPFKLWTIVALITGIDMVSYALSKIIGKTKGLMITSIIGGFISSTATTQSLALESKSSKTTNSLVAAAIFANLASFMQHIVLIAPINSVFLISSLPVIIAMFFSGLVIGLFFLIKHKKAASIQVNSIQSSQEIEDKKIFSLAPAINFALLFLVIKIVTRISLILFGNNGFIITSAFASVTGVDAVTINTAELTGKTIALQTGVATLVLINVVNMFSKSVYSFLQGKREFAIKFSFSVALISISGVLAYLFI